MSNPHFPLQGESEKNFGISYFNEGRFTMDREEKVRLEKYYSEISDEEVMESLLGDKNDYQEGAYELLLAEAKKRRISDEEIKRNKLEARYGKMPREELIALLCAEEKDLMEEDLSLLQEEAKRRDIQDFEREKFSKILEHLNNDPQEKQPELKGEFLSELYPLILIDNLSDLSAIESLLSDNQIKSGFYVMIDPNEVEKANALLKTFGETGEVKMD